MKDKSKKNSKKVVFPSRRSAEGIMPQIAEDAIDVYRTVATVTDPQGSYTGLPVNSLSDKKDGKYTVKSNGERPVQDADDL